MELGYDCNRNNNTQEKETTHDFLGDNVGILILMGYGNSRKPKYILYLILVYLIHLYTQAMSIVAMIIVSSDSFLMIKCFHVLVLTSYSMWGITSRILSNQVLDKTREVIRSGIYHYVDERVDEVEIKMQEDAVTDIRMRSKAVQCGFLVAGLLSLTVLPLLQLLLVGGSADGDLNPYIPHPMYMPFDTSSFHGYLAAMLINLQYVFFSYGNASFIPQIYVSCTIQLRAQLQILNYKLRKLEYRAYAKYFGGDEKMLHTDVTALYAEKKFQDCLYECVRSNALHHQALMRFQKEFQRFVGACLVITAGLGSLDYAASLYILIQNPEPVLTAVYLIMFLAEISYNYFLCYAGQEIIDESSLLLESLYETPWYSCDKRVSRIIDIMMCNTLKPLQIRTFLFNFSASLKTYGHVITTMYKLVNLVRQ